MMRSLYSGVSGLKVHQTKMDVIGNNIANVNTVGFKSSSVRFSDVFYQTTQSATGPNDTTGAAGKNAMQIGLGAGVSSITTSINQTGGSQRTDNPFDVMISGDAFFIVNSGGTNYFTKAGDFNIDSNGTLCTSSGATVMGWQVDPADESKILVDTVSPLRVLSADKMYSPPEATTKAQVTGNIDMKDEQLIGNDASGRNVQIPFYDKMGNKFNIKLNIKQNVDGTGAAQTNQYSVVVTDVLDSNTDSIFKIEGTEVAQPNTFTFGETEYEAVINAEGKVELQRTSGTDNLIQFTAGTGAFTGVGANGTEDKTLTIQLGTAGEDNQFGPIEIDFSSMTMYGTNGSSSLSGEMGGKDGTGAGKQVGNMTGVGIDSSGKLYGKYDNGDSVLLGQIAVASFSNAAGLEAVGGNLFATTQNSGEFDGIGQDPSAGGGSLTTGVLEMSNVDLSAEFTEMITTQRGFQANSRIITTSDTLLEELINLKR